MRTLPARLRWIAYAIAALATAGAMAWVNRMPEDEATPIRGAVRPSARSTADAIRRDAVSLDARRLQRARQGLPVAADPFAAGGWQAAATTAVAPMPAASAAPVVAVQAAPPYAFVGRWVESGQQAAILDHGGQTTVVRAGEVMDGHWRVDAVSEDRLVLTDLARHERDILPLQAMGGASPAEAAPPSGDGSSSSGSPDGND